MLFGMFYEHLQGPETAFDHGFDPELDIREAE
jgi:hypothetical protein